MPSGSRVSISKFNCAAFNYVEEEKLLGVSSWTSHKVSTKTQHRPTKTFKEAICIVVEKQGKKKLKPQNSPPEMNPFHEQ